MNDGQEVVENVSRSVAGRIVLYDGLELKGNGIFNWKRNSLEVAVRNKKDTYLDSGLHAIRVWDIKIMKKGPTQEVKDGK